MRVVVAWLFASLAAVACNSIDGADKYQNVDAVDSGDSSSDAVNNPDGPQTCTQACLDTSLTCQTTCTTTKQDCLNKCSTGNCQNQCNSDYQTCSDQCTSACLACTCSQQQCQSQQPKDAGTDGG